MMKKNAIMKEAAYCVIILHLAGCAENKYIKTEDRLCVPAATQADAMAAAERVLADMHFEIEKLDSGAGYIRTHSLSGAQTFELWRSDSVGGFNREEADLHSIRRAVELNVSQQAGQLCINCRVTTQRLSIHSEQTADKSYTVMSGQNSLQKISREQRPNITWIDLGRDGQLETEILKRIEKRLSTAKKEKVK